MKTSRNTMMGALTMTFLTVLFLGSVLGFFSNATTSPDSVTLNIPTYQTVYVTAPSTSNITVVSVTGQNYSLQSNRQFNSNILSFTPSNSGRYTILLNVSSLGANFAYVAKQATPVNVAACNNCNFTGQGNLLILLNVNSTSGTAQGSSWDPLFGMLPLRLQGFSVSFYDVIGTIAVFGFVFLGLGIAFRSKVAYLGIAILFIIGAIILGLFVLLGIVGLYLLGFALINIVWKYKTWRGRK
jgi:hypothetical protein